MAFLGRMSQVAPKISFQSVTVVGWSSLDTRCPPNFHHSSPQRGGGRKWDGKNLVGWDTGSLLKWNVTLKRRKISKNFILYIPWGSDVWWLPGKQDFSTCSGCSGSKHCKIMNVLSFYFLAFISEHMSYGMEYHCSVYVSCPGYVVSQDFAHPKPAGVGGNVGNTAWMLWEHCSTIAKTLLCFQGLPSYCYKSQALRAAEGKMISASARASAWKQWKILLKNGLSCVWFQGFPSSTWVGHFKNECWDLLVGMFVWLFFFW